MRIASTYSNFSLKQSVSHENLFLKTSIVAVLSLYPKHFSAFFYLIRNS